MASKSKRRGRVFRASCILAALIIAGSSFAWFTSKDEVTNRLSASANYGVSIVEDFQPPKNWVPGQEINKDVGAVNTGNVDAFVRMWLEGEMTIINKLPTTDSTAIPATVATKLGFTDTVAGDKMKELGYLFKDNNNYYKVLSTEQIQNPNDPDDTNTTNTDNDPAYFSEVQSVQAGGYLVSAPASAQWKYTTEQQETVVLKDGTTEVIPAGTVVGTTGTSGASKIVKDAPCVIDSDTFTPVTPGLYIFRRTITVAGPNAADTYQYSGYVFDGVNYFALSTETSSTSDYVLPTGAVTAETTTEPQKEPLTYTLDNSKIKLFTAKETVVDNSGLTWAYDDSVAGSEKLTATYNGGITTDDTDDIVIEVALANIGSTDQTWTPVAASGKMETFYYNDDVEAGDTTAKLIDSVKLADDTKKEAFIAFDFDLNVFMNSVQVTIGENGNEKTTPVESGGEFSGTAGNAAPASATQQDAAEIEDITWS